MSPHLAERALTARVAVEVRGAHVRVRLGDGTRRGALRAQDWSALGDAVDDLGRRASVRCLSLRGTGGHFCSGSDLSAWANAARADVEDDLQALEAVFRAVEDAPVPVVAVLEGAAVGAGCQLALACDLRVAAASAVLGMPTAALGISPSATFAARLAALAGPARARELLYTGRLVDRSAAETAGLVELCARDDELEDVLDDLVAQLVARPRTVIAATKAAVSAVSAAEQPATRSSGPPRADGPAMRAALARYRRGATPPTPVTRVADGASP